MRLIFKCKFGSHLYGTDTEKSDLDFKGVFIPDARSLVLQTAAKTINKTTKKGTEKNTADDVDSELISVSQYIKLLIEGQTMALDMLFCPPSMILEKTEEWDWIVKNAVNFLLHSGTSAFVGYTRQQAAKYGVKGFRVAALREILDWLNNIHEHATLDVLSLDTLPENENIKIVQIQTKVGLESYLEVCNRKVPMTATVKYAKEVYQRVFNAYGERALKAEKNEGVDWKALSHAVRVAYEAVELLETGQITFPRPERALLLDIKNGNMLYKDVEKIIEEGLLKVEQAQSTSFLPKEPNYKQAQEMVYRLHLMEITKDMDLR